MNGMPRRIAYFLAGLLVLAVVAVSAVLMDPFGWRTPGPTSQQGRANPSASTSNGVKTEDDIKNAKDAHDVTEALSHLASDPASVASADIKARVAADPTRAVPPGTNVAPQAQTWAPDGLGGGTMAIAITPPGGSKKIYLALMVKEADAWKISMTWPVNPSPSTQQGVKP